MIKEYKIGPHRIVHEREDLIINHMGQDPTEAEMIAMIEADAEAAGSRPIYLIVDLSKVQTLSAPVRRAIGDSAKRIRYKCIGIYGASFQIKVVAKLINSAIALFRKEAFPQDFFDTREKALAWVDDLRARERAGAA